ncbi:MAG: glycosyltransferase [Candidatus Limnocylindrales bacterium]
MNRNGVRPRSRPPGQRLAPVLSVVVPAYESAAYIGATVAKLIHFFTINDVHGEVVVVDDGSRDDTAAVAASAGASTIRQDRNRGKGAALRIGMLAARGDVRAFTDADLPYGTAPLYPAMQCIIERRFHAVLGDRTLPGSSYESARASRAIVSSAASFVFRTLVTGGIYDTQCGFKAFRGDVAKEIFSMTRIDGFAIDVELIYLLLKHRLDIKRLPVQLERNAKSSVRVIRDSSRAFVDIARMRTASASGKYRSDYLVECLKTDMLADEAHWSIGHPDLAAGPRQALESGAGHVPHAVLAALPADRGAS